MDIFIGNTRRYQLSYKTLSTLATCYFETAQLLYHCQNTSARITYHFELSDATSNKYNITKASYKFYEAQTSTLAAGTLWVRHNDMEIFERLGHGYGGDTYIN